MESAESNTLALELTLLQARALASQLVDAAETQSLADELQELRGADEGALNAGLTRLLADRLVATREDERYRLLPLPSGEFDLAATFKRLRPHRSDAEVRAQARRLEQALFLETGAVLEVPKGEEAGTLFPFINMNDFWPTRISWERLRCDVACSHDAEVVVVRPEAPDPGPSPVVVFLAGNAMVDGRNSIWGGCFAALLQNEVVRNKFYLFHPLPTTLSGLVQYTGEGFRVAWSPDAVWAAVTEVLRRLGPEKVDPGRICFTGISLGGVGCWRLAITHGSMIAAVAPVSGACDWPDESWPRGSGPKEEVLEHLRNVAICAYHTDTDDYAGSPEKDMRWLTYRYQETSFDIQIAGLGVEGTATLEGEMHQAVAFGTPFPCVKEEEDGLQKTRQATPAELKRIDVNVRKWRSSSAAPMELWMAKGPLFEMKYPSGHNTSHVLHYRVFLNSLWGLTSFFMENRVPLERQWQFGSPPFQADSTQAKRALDAQWGPGWDTIAEVGADLSVDPTRPLGELWQVVGGADSGGIVVRHGRDFESTQDPVRLASGAVVARLELWGQRLLYTLLYGKGPPCGWVSTTSSKGKSLLRKIENPEEQFGLTGLWQLNCESGLVVRMFCRQEELEKSDFSGQAASPELREELHGSVQDGGVDLQLGESCNIKGRFDGEKRRMENLVVTINGDFYTRAFASWEHELTHLKEAGPFRIYLNATSPGEETMCRWYLGAERFSDRDKRGETGAFVFVRRNDGLCPVPHWELAPGTTTSRFRIRMASSHGYDWRLGPMFMKGWCLCAQSDRVFSGKETPDCRDPSSNFVSIQKPDVWKDVSQAEWEIYPGRTAGQYRLKLQNMADARDWVDGFWISAQRNENKDMRTERSTYLCVQSDSWEPGTEVYWEFEPKSSPNTYTIKLVRFASNNDNVGWYLGASRQLITDKRSLDSTYAYIHAPVLRNPKFAEWELEPAGTENIYRIKLHSLPDKSDGAGWYLGVQNVFPSQDFRNSDSMYLCVQNPDTWPDAKMAEWELHPETAGEKGVYRVQLKSMPNRANRSGCWLSARNAVERERRDEHSCYASVASSESSLDAVACDWSFEL